MIKEGAMVERTVSFTETMVSAFADLTDDRAPVHFDAGKAKAMGYQGRIVHGLLVSSIFSELLGCHLPGPSAVIQKISLDFIAPVYVGESVRFEVKVSRYSEAVKAVSLALSSTNSESKVVCRGTAACVMRQ